MMEVRISPKAAHSGGCPNGWTLYLPVVEPDSYYEK